MGRATRGGVTGEVFSSNHKYLEIVLRLPPELERMAEEIREIVRRHCRRGFITLTLRLEENCLLFKLNVARLKKYLSLFQELKERFAITGEASLSDIIRLPEIFQTDLPKELRKNVREVVSAALAKLQTMRKEEGENLLVDFRHRLMKVSRLLKEIKKRIPKRLKEKEASLVRKFQEVATPVPENRIKEEAIIFAGRTDVSEELTRLLSHSRLFLAALRKKSTSGRKLEFILQEMLRETETLSSKGRDFFVAKTVIALKEEIEKMREQARNVE